MVCDEKSSKRRAQKKWTTMSAVRRGGRKNCGGARRPEEDHRKKNIYIKKKKSSTYKYIGIIRACDLATVRSKRLNVALPIDDRRSSPVISVRKANLRTKYRREKTNLKIK